MKKILGTAWNAWTTAAGWINHLAWMALIIMLPLPHHDIATVGIAVWLIAWAAEGRWLNPKNFKIKGKRYLVPFGLIACLWAWEGVSALWAAEPHWTWRLMEKQLYILVPLVMGLWGVNRHYTMQTTLRVLAATGVGAIFVYLFALWCVKHSADIGDFQSLYATGEHTRSLRHLFTHALPGIKHRTYLAYVMLMGLVSLPFITPERRDRETRAAWGVIRIIAGGVLVWGICLTGARGSLVSLVSIGIAGATWSLVRSRGVKRKILVGAYLAGSIGVIGLLGTNQRLREGIAGLHGVLRKDKAEFYADPDIEPRLKIWRSALGQWGDYALLGVGGSMSYDYLCERYEAEGNEECLRERWGAHSDYLGTWMETGIVGLLLLLAAVGTMGTGMQGAPRLWARGYAIVWGTTILTESMLHRVDGAIYCAVFGCMAWMFEAERARKAQRKSTEKWHKRPSRKRGTGR